MNSAIAPRTGNALGLLVCLALIGYALYAEHVLGLAPCPLCIFQRIAIIVMGGWFLLAALHNPGRKGLRGYGAVMLLTATLGAAVAIRQIWIQMQPPGSVAACGADLGYLMDIMSTTEVIAKVLTGSGECGKIDWTFLGLSMPWWVLFALIGLSAWAIYVNMLKRRVAAAF